MDISTIVSSALVAAAVSGVALLVNGHLERKNRQKELLFNLAFKLAESRQEFTWKMAQATNKAADFRDIPFGAEVYYRWLRRFFDDDKLPQEAHEAEKKSKRDLGL